MRIAFIISSLGSGGAERVLSLLASNLSKKHKIIVVTFSKEKPFYDLNKNIDLIQLDLIKNSQNIYERIINTFRRTIALKKTLKEIDADINISFMTHTNILSIISSKFDKQKIIVSEDIEYFFYSDKILFSIRKIVYKFSNYLVVKTYSDAKNYFFMKNVCVIPNPLPRLPKIEQNIKKDKFILAVGRLEKQKGFDTLIEAYKYVNSNWKLYIAGEGNERSNLESLIETLQLNDKVILLGNQKNIFEWYRRASIFVLSSRKEGFGNVLIEAMAMGCAVVSFDCPYGPAEIIKDGIDGILVENQNTRRLSQAIQKLIEDEELRSTLANEAIKVRERYSIDKIANEWESLISKVVYE